MSELIDIVIAFFGFWGAWLGVLLAALIAWPLSVVVWGEFHVGLFCGLCVPLVAIGVYVQHVVERRN